MREDYVTATLEPVSRDSAPWQGPRPGEFGRLERWVMVIAAIGLLGLLGVTRLLTPNESGVGTHRALGLPPCGSIVMWGIPCPSCGMTTSWSWFVRGNFGRSWAANPGGFLLAIFVLVMSAWLGISGLFNRWWPVRCEPFLVLSLGAIVLVVTLAQWIGRLL
jgi:hypothetical protein